MLVQIRDRGVTQACGSWYSQQFMMLSDRQVSVFQFITDTSQVIFHRSWFNKGAHVHDIEAEGVWCRLKVKMMKVTECDIGVQSR